MYSLSMVYRGFVVSHQLLERIGSAEFDVIRLAGERWVAAQAMKTLEEEDLASHCRHVLM